MTATVEAARISVLVVEDSADHRVLMERQLRAAGIDVRTAATGEEALTHVDAVDLVLLDYRLPRMSGLDTLHAIRQMVGGPSVVMVTGMGSTEVAVEAMRAGAIDYLAKNPGYLQALPNVIERAWRHHDLARRADELQRLALLLHSADDRDVVRDHIVDGAQRLLRADAATLVEFVDGTPRVHRLTGEPGASFDALVRRPRSSLPDPGEAAIVGPRDIAVALPADDGEPYAVLAVFGHASSDALGEELELARVFASFAAVALRNLRRRELEEALIGELQQTIEARRDFVASVSHELRTPLTSIGGYAETLLERWEAFDEATKRDFLQRVRRNSLELGQLVEQLIDVAGLERGERFGARIEAVPLRAAIASSLEQMAMFVAGREVTVEVPDVEVLSDRALLHRTLANLLSNAVKFSAPDTPIGVAAEVDGALVHVDVTDHGIGLEPREAARVFDPFWRAGSSVANAVRGSGIGLALVREYLRSMGGEVSVHSAPGVGSTFRFTLPLATGRGIDRG